MTNRYLVIYTSKDTNKYQGFSLIPKQAMSNEELLKEVEIFNKESENTLATYHENDIFTEFVEEITGRNSYLELIGALKKAVQDINDNICELKSIYDDIQEVIIPEHLVK